MHATFPPFCWPSRRALRILALSCTPPCRAERTRGKEVGMKHVTWPVVVVVVAVLAAVSVMFGLERDPAMRQQILGYFDILVPFIVGVAAGAGAGAAAGFAGGYLRGHSAGKAEAEAAAESLQLAGTVTLPIDEVRRAADVVRVAADESDRAADAARVAAAALKMAAEEGRAAVDLQRSLLDEFRRTALGGPDAAGRSGARPGAPSISVQR